ncbi:hypothetical protein CUMW_241700 [Citrus unshiu]|uniref:Uncharacterized protein n=1 Tax=Citrus unshiu TaxID=55188 RepID=A0A2H5QLL7_CITUN|nr:hypothetical protein CUMW_241700 [Citrus unshiu]
MGQANNSTPPNESYIINPMPLRMMPPPGYQNPRRRTNDPSIDQNAMGFEGEKIHQDEVLHQLTNFLQGLVGQAAKELKQNCQVPAVPAKPLSVPEDNDAGSSSSKAKNKTKNDVLVGKIYTSFQLPEDYPVLDLDLDKLPVPAYLLDRLMPHVKRSNRSFSFMQRMAHWRIERKLRSNWKNCDMYFIHQTSDELLRSAIEVVNFILYEIVPRDLMKTKKNTLEEDKSSELETGERTQVEADPLRANSKQLIPENQARASGKRVVTKKVKICLKYEFSEEHLIDVMKFSREFCEHLRSSFEKYSDKRFKKNRKSTTQQQSLTKKAIKALARELNQMLHHSFKKINMQDLYLECKRLRTEGAKPSSSSSTASSDEFAVRKVDRIMHRCFEEAKMLEIYSASKRVRSEHARIFSDSKIDSRADNSLASLKFNDFTCGFHEHTIFQDSTNIKMVIEEDRIVTSDSTGTTVDESMGHEFDELLYSFCEKANLLDIYLASKRMKTVELTEEGNEKCAATPEAEMEDTVAVASPPNHVAE